MLALRLLQEGDASTDISWLVWVVLAIFLLMVLLGWWASGRLPKEEGTVPMHSGESEHDSHGEGAAGHEEQVVVNHEEQRSPTQE
jgi:hypothetical protein